MPAKLGPFTERSAEMLKMFIDGISNLPTGYVMGFSIILLVLASNAVASFKMNKKGGCRFSVVGIMIVVIMMSICGNI